MRASRGAPGYHSGAPTSMLARRGVAVRLRDRPGGSDRRPSTGLSLPLPDEEEVVLREDVVPAEGALLPVGVAEVHEAVLVELTTEAILPEVGFHEGYGGVIDVHRSGMVLVDRPPQ